ncbi:hypothetical protein, partial [Paraglaciecola sp.]|uniref:hypothetical protein n=1 Tax=Paraglaciecola sp. TaxID=1920173 RepID=UPI003EF0B951
LFILDKMSRIKFHKSVKILPKYQRQAFVRSSAFLGDFFLLLKRSPQVLQGWCIKNAMDCSERRECFSELANALSRSHAL